MYNKLLLIISGECFRDGGQYSRLKDTDKSVETQLIAIESHIKFIEYLKAKHNIETDIHFLSYASKNEALLIDKYKPYNLVHKLYDKYYPDRTQLTNSYKIEGVESRYDGVLVIRPDIKFKDYFFDIFDPKCEQILYPSLCLIGNSHIHGLPRVNDTILFVPNIYLNMIYYKIGLKVYHHSILDYLANNLKLADFNFMLKTLHDSDTAKDYNPLYSLVSRHNTKVWHSYGLEVREKDFMIMETDTTYTFPDWNMTDHLGYHYMSQVTDINNVWEWWHEEHGYNKFIDLIELNLDNVMLNTYNEVKPSRCHLETYWSLKEHNKLYFYDENKNITSILFKKNPYEFAGKCLVSNAYFHVKKRDKIK